MYDSFRVELVYFGDEFFGLLNVQLYGVQVLILALNVPGLKFSFWDLLYV